MDQTTYLTQEGLDKLRAEFEDLKKVQRPEMISRLEAAKALGDLSENAEYHEAKDNLAFIEGRIRELDVKLRDVELIENDKKDGGTVKIGSTIEVEAKGNRRVFQIVGSSEADPAGGRISNESPLGSSFLGRKKGDEVEVITPSGETVYTILSVK
ncbi:MAG: transcription elongation factor GreA [Candidatus Uhrbacteria bacterium]|nr:transcription elongation factor GreA [Candidatus Uhrbacteria bacterium]